MSRGAGGIVGLQSGRVGGIVLKQREGKQIISEFFKPQNPQTERQTEVRSINTELSRSYRDDLNQGQRNAWMQRAEGIPGLRGETLYIKQNFQLLDFGLPRQMTPPPMVMPPELSDLSEVGGVAAFDLIVPQLTAGIITAQEPFLDIEVAGGFLTANFTDNGVYELEIDTQALSQGRVHQQSDFRHVFYAPDKPVITPPALESLIMVLIPGLSTRNVVLRIRRYNMFGNFSEARIFSKVVIT